MSRPRAPRAPAPPRPTPRRATGRRATAPRRGQWGFRVYVAGSSPRSRAALSNLTRICEEHLPGRFRIEVIDLLQDPRLASRDQILALPTVVRTIPLPARRVIGDLSNTPRVLAGLDIRPSAPDGESPQG